MHVCNHYRLENGVLGSALDEGERSLKVTGYMTSTFKDCDTVMKFHII